MVTLEELMDRISPSPRLRAAVTQASDELLDRVRELAEKMSLDVRVRLVGSVAKDTYVHEPDIDVFVLFDPGLPRKMMEEKGLEIGRMAIGGEERYAEHPYIHGIYKGFDVDVVPCYAIEDTRYLLSAVDRTPFHTDFVISRLRPDQRGEVRLLKQFMKGIGAYGAEAKVEGFSGYLVELMVLRFGDFREVIREASSWKEGTVLFLEHPGSKRFSTPLVFYDPVDGSRNVASALSIQCFSLFVHACREFQKSPDERFFFPRKGVQWNRARLNREMARRGTRLLAVRLVRPDLTDDNLYPQMRKTLEGAEATLEAHDFAVLSRNATAARDSVYLLLELQTDRLPRGRRHVGPPASSDNSESFLAKWREGALTPPYLENGRWVVMRHRQYTRASDALRNELGKASLGSGMRNLEGMRVMAHGEVMRSAPARVIAQLLDRRFPWQR